MPTIVLSEPIAERIKSAEKIKSGDSAAGTAAKMVGPQIKKAIELGGKAREMIERRLKSRLAAMTAAPSVSSTAKTKDLTPHAGAASYGAHPGSTLESSPTNTGPRAASGAKSSRSYSSSRDSNSDRLYTESNSNGTDPAKAPAKLVARGDETEFGIFGMRTLIGRSHDATDKLDIDLKPLAHGGERVSRRHAEIVKRGGDYFIRDLGSLNGTYIAGRGKLGRDQLYKLKDRDQVVLGGAILQFRKR
jgi:FHA domain-containing protein